MRSFIARHFSDKTTQVHCTLWLCSAALLRALRCCRARSQDDWLSVIWPGKAKSESVVEADSGPLDQPPAAQLKSLEAEQAQAVTEQGGAASGLG